MSAPGGHHAITECPFTHDEISIFCSPIKTGAPEAIFVRPVCERLAWAGMMTRIASRRKTRGIRLGNMKSNFKTLMIKIITFY
jgi:hypothetical protein